jgi:hypothetical protein
MNLGCRFLTSVADVNTFTVVSSLEMSKGTTQNVYFQLIDGAVDTSSQGFSPTGRRYCPPVGATLAVTLQNIDDAKVIQRTAVQAFPTADASIWYVPILAPDPLAGTVVMQLTLTEPGPVVRTLVDQKGVVLRVK